jgi:hypothetical protein
MSENGGLILWHSCVERHPMLVEFEQEISNMTGQTGSNPWGLRAALYGAKNSEEGVKFH